MSQKPPNLLKIALWGIAGAAVFVGIILPIVHRFFGT
jgi:hypothetical protein